MQQDASYSINIERAVLSSILFNPEELDSTITILEHKDFYYVPYQNIYKQMAKLHKQEMPIDEQFIRGKQGVEDDVLIDIMAANPITNTLAYVNEIKEASKKRELEKLVNQVRHELEKGTSRDILDFLQKRIKELSTVSTTFGNFKDFLKKDNKFVTKELLDSIENIELLYNGLLPKNQITTFVGEANVGKSALTFGLIAEMFKLGVIDTLLYFDNDNSLNYTKNRIEKLIEKYGNDRIMYYSGSTASKVEMIDVMKALCNYEQQGKKVLIVNDSLKDFINGTVNSDEAINEFFDVAKRVRDVFGATLIALHHTKKGKNDSGNDEYVGSQAIRSSTDNMQYLRRTEAGTLITRCDKMRAMLNEKMAFHIDFEEMTLTETEVREDEDEITVTSDIIERLGDKEMTIKQLGVSKDMMIKIVKTGGIIAREENGVWYYRRNQVVVETVFDMPEVL